MYNVLKKTDNIKLLNSYMLTKTLSMFEWFNLPDTIPQKELEKQLQEKGYTFITKVEDKLYAFTGGLGGEQDAYGNATQIVIANPYLKFNKTLDIEKDGVLISNDDLRLGLLPYYEKQNSLLVENDINMYAAGVNSRIKTILTAPDDKSKSSAELYLKDISDGKITSVVTDNTMFDGLKVHNAASNGSGVIKELLEYQQYLKSNLYNEVGLSSNFNMKRERLLSAEVDQSEDSLFPLVYNMIQNRMIAIKKLNDMFELDLSVDFGSVWHYKNKQLVDGVPENENSQSLLTADSGNDIQVVESDLEQEEEQGENPEQGEPEQGEPEQVEDEILIDEDLEREQDHAPEPEPEPEPEIDVENSEEDEEKDEVKENE